MGGASGSRRSRRNLAHERQGSGRPSRSGSPVGQLIPLGRQAHDQRYIQSILHGLETKM